jgi:CheY-like chemotaxis protein
MPARILVVDDEETVCGFLERLLSRAGYDVVTEESGQAAIARAHSEPFDLLLVDKNLPGLTGLDVIEAIRVGAPYTPALLMTAYPEPLLGRRVRLEGYLAKPFDSIDTVLAAVEEVLALCATEAARREKRDDDTDEKTPVMFLRLK